MTTVSQPRKSKKISISDWIMAIWFSLSSFVLLYSFFKAVDEVVSRRELAISIFITIFLTTTLLLTISQRKKTLDRRWLALALSLAVGGFLSAIFAENVFPTFMVIRNLDIRVLERDEEAEIGLVWAYWATQPANDEEIPQPLTDISFANFETAGSWSQVEGQPLKTSESGDSLHFKLNGIHFHMPVVTMLSEGGKALVEVNFNGNRSFYRLNGVDRDPLVIDSMAPSTLDMFLFLLLYTAVFAGLIFWPLLFLLNLFCK